MGTPNDHKLIMMLDDISKLNDNGFKLQDGYTSRCFREGDEVYWENIIDNVFDYPNKANFNTYISSNPYYLPERVRFVCYNDIPVSTATAWYKDLCSKYENCGYLHLVAALGQHCGKGIGRQVCVDALLQIKKDGFNRVVLETEDFRLQAIKLYKALGFKPVYADEESKKRWDIINEKFI